MKKVRGRITEEQYERLEAIRKEYGFRSVYQIFNYLIDCFIRSAAPAPGDSPVHEDISSMFAEVSDRVDGMQIRRGGRF